MYVVLPPESACGLSGYRDILRVRSHSEAAPPAAFFTPRLIPNRTRRGQFYEVVAIKRLTIRKL